MRLKHFLSVFLTLFTLSVGQMWGTDELVYTLDGAITGTGSGYGTANDITQGEKDWKVTGNTTMNPWRLGGKGITNQNRNIYTTFTFSEDISKVTVQTGTTGNSLTVNSVKLIVSASQNGGGDKEEISKTSSLTNTTLTFSRPSGHDWSGKYFTIVFNVTRSSSSGSNGYVEFKNAKFYKEAAVAHIVTLMDDTSHPLQEQSAGAGVTLPTRTGCTGYTFAGWTASWVEEQDEWTTIAPTIISAGTYHPAADVNLYPVYTKTISGESTTTTFNFSYTDWGKSSSFSGTDYNEVSQEDDGITVTYTRNSGSLYANTTSLRFYKSNELTFDAGENSISAISFTGTVGQEDITTDVETCTNTSSSLSWEGTANSVTFTRPNNASSYATLSSATVTHTGGSTTSYISVPNCCTPLGQINGSFFWSTHFCPVWPAKHRS